MNVQVWIAMCFITGTALSIVESSSAQQPGKEEAKEVGKISNESRLAIAKGLKYLANQQHKDGSWGTDRFKGNLGVTSLVARAFLDCGHLPGKGKYGKELSKTVEYIIHSETKKYNGRPSPGLFINSKPILHGQMYSHGFVTLFLAEVFGSVEDKEIRDKIREPLKRAVKLIIRSQNREGGWRYHPIPTDADITMTVCQMNALSTAKAVGIQVPKLVLEKGIKYIKSCQDKNSGGFRYRSQGGPVGFARTASAITALRLAGERKGDEVKKGLIFLTTIKLDKNPFRIDTYYAYGHYYTSKALTLSKNKFRKHWYARTWPEILKRRSKDGHWDDSVICPHYETAMMLLVLQSPNSNLLDLHAKR